MHENYNDLFIRQARFGFALHKILSTGCNHPSSWQITEVNPSFEQITGLKSNEAIGSTVEEILNKHAENQSLFLSFYRNLNLEKPNQTFEQFHPTSAKWFEVQSGIVDDSHFSIVLNNITHLKTIANQRIETSQTPGSLTRNPSLEMIRESEDVRLMGYEIANMGIWKNDLTTGEIFLDERARGHYGLTQEKLMITDVIGVVHPDDVHRLTTEIQSATAPGGSGKFSTEYRVIHPDGSLRWLAISVKVAFGGEGENQRAVMGYGTTMDITEKKYIENKLSESEKLYKSRLDNLLEGCQILGDDWRYIYINRSAEIHNRRPKHEMLGKTYTELWPGIESTEVFTRIKKCLENREFDQWENYFEFPDGRFGWYWLSLQPVSEGILILSIDVTEKKLAEQAIHESKARLEAALNSMTDAVFISDTNGNFVEFNEAFATYHKFKNKNECSRSLNTCSQFLEVHLANGEPAPVEMWAAARALRGETGSNVEYSLRRTDTGEEWTGSYSFAPIKDADGKITGSVVVGRDITQQKQIQQKLADSEERYRLIADNSLDVIWVINPFIGKFTYVSPSVTKLRGFTPEEVLNQPVWEALTPESLNIVNETLQTNLAEFMAKGSGTVSFVNEVDQPCKDGSIVHTEVTTTFVFNKMGEVEIIGVSRNINDRKAAEEAQKLSRENFRKAFRTSPAALLITRFSDGTFMEMNEAYCNIVGYDVKELTGRKTTDFNIFTNPDDRQKIIENLLSQQKPEYFETTIRNKQGEIKHVVAAQDFVTFNNEKCIMSSFLDITERKISEEKIRESEEKFRMIFESASIGKSNTEINGTVRVNKAFSDMLGYSGEELENKTWQEISHPAEIPFIEKILKPVLSGEKPSIRFEKRYRRKDGNYLWCDVNVAVRFDKNGKPLHFITTVVDISEKKKAEEELRRLNAELENRVKERTAELSDLYNNAPCGYHSLDHEGFFIQINDTELKWLGYTRDEMIGKMKASDLLTEESLLVMMKTFPQLKSQGWVKDVEFDMIRKDQTIIHLLLSASAVYDKDGEFLMSRSTVIDYTDIEKAQKALKESREQLQSANKELESFAYSISHDLRAPLRAIDGFVRMILEDYGHTFDNEAQRMFNVVRDNAKKMDKLITDLLALSRITRAEIFNQTLDMNLLIQSIINENFPIEIIDDTQFIISELPRAMGDQVLIRQALINLISNAIKYTRPVRKRKIEIGGYSEKEKFIYFVKDNGVGFNPQYQHKLFGIFQRLHKDAEFEGTGVGLAIVQRIINRHGGSVWAEGEINKGATFFFSLPSKINHQK